MMPGQRALNGYWGAAVARLVPAAKDLKEWWDQRRAEFVLDARYGDDLNITGIAALQRAMKANNVTLRVRRTNNEIKVHVIFSGVEFPPRPDGSVADGGSGPSAPIVFDE
ncbi:hypothetical protein ACFL26_01850 [Patescibacteria group bacterium]